MNQDLSGGVVLLSLELLALSDLAVSVEGGLLSEVDDEELSELLLEAPVLPFRA